MEGLQKFDQLEGQVKLPKDSNYKSVLVLLHGRGSNEEDLLSLGPEVAPDSVIVSLRAPFVLQPGSYAWYQMAQTWEDAQKSFKMLEESLTTISKMYDVPAKNIVIMGFSQGAIMTLGLALTSPVSYGGYVACSGRTLPEFAAAADKQLPENFKAHRILLTHGTQDSVLPVLHAYQTADILKAHGANYIYKEYVAGHTIPLELIGFTQKWISSLTDK